MSATLSCKNYILVETGENMKKICYMLTFELLARDHPVPSMDVSLRTLRQTSPFSVMLGCHILVLQVTSGGYSET